MQLCLAGHAAPFAVQRTARVLDEPAKLSSNLIHASPNVWVRFFHLHAFAVQSLCFWCPNSMPLKSKLNAFGVQTQCFLKVCSGCFVTNCYSDGCDIAASEALRRDQRLQSIIRLFVAVGWSRGLV